VLQDGQLMLTTIRSHDQFNTTIYGLDDRYRGIVGGRRIIFLNPVDITKAGLSPGVLVDVTSLSRGQERTMRRVQVVEYDIARRSAAMYFPEANALIPIDSVADESNTPTSKSIPITVRRTAGGTT
jgi:anaerobic selenocysteine-containing dehydrogenase